jgi:hypothetical protein
MSTLRSGSYALGALALASVFAVYAIGGLKAAALDAPAPRHLFVSDPQAGIVTIFSIPDLAVKKTITGFSQPQGLCSDGHGNVWVTNRGTQQILKYSHDGTHTLSLTDPNGFPYACSVDRGTGDLAVANIHNVKGGQVGTPAPQLRIWSGPGETERYPGGCCGPLPSNDWAPMTKVYGEAYNKNMNLFIDGQTKSGAFVLAMLPAGSTEIAGITVTGGTIHLPGMLHWDPHDKYLAVGDRRCDNLRATCVYQVSISGTTAKIKSKITLEAYNGHTICDMAQGVIYDSAGVTYLAGGDDESSCHNAATSVNVWSYPAGGLPRHNNHSIPFAHPFGTATSALH